jgi:ubiquitin conjugation factor E4 A
MHQAQTLIRAELIKFFYDHLIKSNSNDAIRNLWLKWVCLCLEDNRARAQDWNAQQQIMSQLHMSGHHGPLRFASDGFFLNLLDTFLAYSAPFCADKCRTSRDKLLKINTSYASPDFKNKHALVFDKETRLVPRPESQQSSQEQTTGSFNSFISECFFITNDLIRLGYMSIYQKLMKLNGELARWQSTYQDLMSSNADTSNNNQMATLKSHYECMSIEFLNFKTCLIEESLVKNMSKFLFNSASWLVMLTESSSNSTTPLLSQVPEFFLTNINEFLIFLHRFKVTILSTLFDVENSEFLTAFIDLVIGFMGRSDRLFNPHQRAQLAEALECLLPKRSGGAQMFDHPGGQSLAVHAFVLNKSSSQLAESLLNVFVSIEMTGQSVRFEEKFNYRRPMYELIEYLWSLPGSSDTASSLPPGMDLDRKMLYQHRNKLKGW